MKLTILPNWCKWVSFAMFITSFVIGFSRLDGGAFSVHQSAPSYPIC